MSRPLKNLLLAANLGLNKNHRLAGWNILMILYHDSSTSSEPSTLDFLARQYNNEYLDVENQEEPISDNVLRTVLNVLIDQAGLIEVNTRKVRRHTESGKSLIKQTALFKITSSGIEYLRMMQKVVDAETTITANTQRIDEYCLLVKNLTNPEIDATTTKLYNDFTKMLAAYEDVMKGMHKLDEDLNELANDLAFNHGSQAASHLQKMLQKKAVPAYRKLLQQAGYIKGLFNLDDFANRVARSQQGQDNLDTAAAIGNQSEMLQQFNRTKAYVQKHLRQMTLSFASNSQAIDNSLDSIYLLFQTILSAIQLLSEEFDHIHNQTIDVKTLTEKINDLLPQYSTLKIAQQLPSHAPFDRDEIEDINDLLEADALGPVKYIAKPKSQRVFTTDDNPTIAEDESIEKKDQVALAEFSRLVMQTPELAVIDHDLELESMMARDEIVKLYAATAYDHYEGFAAFGRSIRYAERLPEDTPICLHFKDDIYTVFLPNGFKVRFN